MDVFDRLLLTLAALAGFGGVALSAVAAHATGGSQLETAARFLLIHAAALVGLVALAGNGFVQPSVGRLAGWAMIIGIALFAGDLALRAWRGAGLFPMAAPMGGFLMMGGWALLALAALIGGRGA